MVYVAEPVTPANTPAESPVDTELIVTAGWVYKITVHFPPGSGGLLHVQILDGAFQVWPTTQGQSFRGDSVVFTYEESYQKAEPPYLFVVRCWNLDDTYEHTVGVHVALMSDAQYQARFLPGLQMSEITALLASANVGQKAAQQAALTAFVDKYAGRKAGG
jgi:hypothetical protein